MRAFKIVVISQTPVLASPSDRGFGSPEAPPVFTHARTGPKESSSEVAGVAKQVCNRPTKEILGVASVLPTGVLQHVAYQRSNPLGVSRMQARASIPCESLTFFGST